jgi:DNA repair protein RadC
MKIKDQITADQIIAGAKAKVARRKVPIYRIHLKKERDIRLPIAEVKSQDDLVHIAKTELGDLPHEELIAIGLDGRNHIIGVVKVSQGGLGSAAIVSRDVIRPLIAMGASAFVVAHNHPSGDPTPSRHDYVMTDALKKAAACVDFTMLDHIVVGNVRAGKVEHREIMNRYETGTFIKD